MTEPRRFRFRPRHRGIAAVTLGLGGVLTVTGVAWHGLVASFPFITGLAGLVLGSAYLASPTWRFVVVVDADAIAVDAGAQPKFRLPWSDVVRVVASPTTRTCFLYGGDAKTSLLVPGDGAPAPYAIEDRAALYDLIVARVDPAKVVEVDTIEQEMARTKAASRGA